MALRILATSDLHLGMTFAAYPEAQARLVEARFGCLERLVDTANAQGCGLLVIAGDLFDRTGVAKRDVLRAARMLREFEGRLVAVLPGNHDHLTPVEDPLWPVFRSEAGDRVLVLDEPRPWPVAELEACLYPAPCRSKRSASSEIGWIAAAAREAGIRHRIGLAHGSVAGRSPDLERRYFPMSEEELLAAGLDLWIVGHTHRRHPERPGPRERMFIPGTPEPDGFDCAHGGTAWLLELDGSETVKAEGLDTGSLRFVVESVELRGPAPLAGLLARHAGAAAARELVQARLGGRIARTDRSALPEAERRLREQVLWLDWNDGEVREAIDRALVDETWPEGSFPHRLMTELLDDPQALELAGELLEEAQG